MFFLILVVIIGLSKFQNLIGFYSNVVKVKDYYSESNSGMIKDDLIEINSEEASLFTLYES
ncbi:hypothetical protein H8356DRAFT_1327862 [Neocallimastix lanati (nom. inval.)]|nr:hypothetical protein H8356DRAFT_1327862 [Neocallimastix sp. JGI-2020a]